MDVKISRSPSACRYLVSAVMEETEIMMSRGAIIRAVIERAAELLAEQFVADHGQDILKALDPQAIANLAIADSSRAVREALEKSIPREVQHHHHHEKDFYRVGLFGGIKRV